MSWLGCQPNLAITENKQIPSRHEAGPDFPGVGNNSVTAIRKGYFTTLCLLSLWGCFLEYWGLSQFMQCLYRYRIPIKKIWWSYCLIFTLEITAVVRWHLYIEMATWSVVMGMCHSLIDSLHKGPVMWSFDVFVISMSKLLNKEWWCLCGITVTYCGMGM